MWAFRSSMSLSVALRRCPPGRPGWHARSVIDLEAVPVGLGGQPFLVQAGDPGARRPLPPPRLRPLAALRCAGDLALDAAVAQVPHAAGQAQLAGHAAHEPAEADALDAPAQPQAQGHPLAPPLPVPETAAATTRIAGAAAAHLPPSFQPWRPTSGTKPTSSPSLRRSSPRADLR